MAGGSLVTCLDILPRVEVPEVPDPAAADADKAAKDAEAKSEGAKKLLMMISSFVDEGDTKTGGDSGPTPVNPPINTDDKKKDYDDALKILIRTGPLLNPALALGLMVMKLNV